MNTKTKSRRVMSVAISKRAEQVLTNTKAETGVTHLAFLERLLEWYAAQDPRIRTMILSPYAEVRKGLARLILEQMEAEPGVDFDPGLQFHDLIHNDFSSDAKRQAPPHLPAEAIKRSKHRSRGS